MQNILQDNRIFVFEAYFLVKTVTIKKEHGVKIGRLVTWENSVSLEFVRHFDNSTILMFRALTIRSFSATVTSVYIGSQ